MRIPGFLFATCFVWLAGCGHSNTDKDGGAPDPVKENVLVDSRDGVGAEKIDAAFIEGFLKRYPEYDAYEAEIQKFYRQRNYRLAWTDHGEPIAHASLFINLIESSRQEGMPVWSKSDYHLRDSLAEILDAGTNASVRQKRLRKAFDVALTSAYFRYAPKIWEGSIDPQREDDIEWYVEREGFAYDGILDSLLNDTINTNPFLQNRGFHEQYFKLRELLKRYSRLKQQHSWDAIEVREHSLSKGDSGEVVGTIVARLALLGDLAEESSGSKFTEQVRQAVVGFQARHGLVADGVVGPSTISALNTSPDERLKQIILNIERWRWVPVGMTGNYVFVNIPEFRLYLVENDERIDTMKVVVGKRGSHTAVFNDRIKYVVTNPYWNIPRSIATQEILPRIKEDPLYLQEQEIEVGVDWNFGTVDADTIVWENITEENFSYTLRRKPGPDNALGQIKFIFPNDFAIYLHDTPATDLFDERRRGFSHGCIRVEKPLVLARHLIARNDDYSFSDLQQLLTERKNKWIELDEPLAVYILYFTVWVDDSGTVHFRKDIYGHDAKLAEALFQPGLLSP